MIDPEIFHGELTFQTSRSGGSGGQNVNKVESKVGLRFDIAGSTLLTDEQKEILYNRLSTKLTTDKILVLYHQTERSQYANKEKVIAKFNGLIIAAFKIEKKRTPTKPTLASRLKRLQQKQRNAKVKALRKNPLSE